MDAFNADLNEALRYHTEQERKSFEDAIDANPLDSTTHLVYADWLQEQGEHEEAEFRRAMGDYIQATHRGETSLHPELTRDFVFPWRVGLQDGRQRYPQGVNQEHMPPSVKGEESPATPPHHPRLFHGHYNWKTYRSMEEAFRRAFKAGRQSPSE